MAHTVSRIISIRWKINPDAFEQINKTILNALIKKFGSATQAVNAILIKDDMLKSLMPIFIGTTPADPDWQKIIVNYWNSLSVDIPEAGKELEIGFLFDLNDKTRKEDINSLKAKYSNIKDDKSLADVVMGNIDEEEIYKYGKPIKSEDYLLWIYSREYRDVANTPNDIDKSPFIRFYIHDENIVKKQREALVDLAMTAQGKLIDIVKSENSSVLIYNILCVLQPDIIATIDTYSDKELQVRLFTLIGDKPKEFIEISSDKNLHTKALIEELLYKRIIRKLPNTDVIVDIEDPTIKIGDTTNDAVAWFNLDVNSAKISEYKLRLKAK